MPIFGFPPIRVIDFDPEFLWSAGEPFPAALIERARNHARTCGGDVFVGTAARWNMVHDWRGILFATLACAACGREIGRGIMWQDPPSPYAYPWQARWWAWAERRVA